MPCSLVSQWRFVGTPSGWNMGAIRLTNINRFLADYKASNPRTWQTSSSMMTRNLWCGRKKNGPKHWWYHSYHYHQYFPEKLNKNGENIRKIYIYIITNIFRKNWTKTEKISGQYTSTLAPTFSGKNWTKTAKTSGKYTSTLSPTFSGKNEQKPRKHQDNVRLH